MVPQADFSPRLRTPFEGDTFSDDFLYPDGNLVGQGPWIVDEFSNPSLIIASHLVSPNGTGNNGASVADCMGGISPTAYWSHRVNCTFFAKRTGAKDLQFWIGNGNTNFAGVYVNFDAATPGAHVASISLFDTSGAEQDADIDIGDPSISHEFEVEFEAGDLKFNIDGVTKVTISGADMTMLDGRNMTVFTITSGTGSQLAISHVAFGN